MSKMFKNILAIALVVAMLVPGLSALANDRHVFPEHFFPEAYSATQRWECEEGSITIVRSAGPYAEEVTSPPHQLIPGVPIRIERVQLRPDGDGNLPVPNETNLRNEQWVRDNTIPVNPADVHYGVTNADGEVEFEGLDLGIWLVRELPTLTVTTAMVANGVNLPAVGETVTNPVNATPDNDEVDENYNSIPIRFRDFLVGLPLYTGDAENPWLCDVRVYPKSEFPTYDNDKLLTDIMGNVATWTLSHQIPNAVGNLPHFGVLDIMSEGLSFVEDSVTGRFETGLAAPNDWRVLPATHFEVIDLYPTVNGIQINVLETGRNYLELHGLAIDGDIEFTVQSLVNRPGAHSNIAEWNVGRPPTDPTPCPVDDPDCEEPELPCPPTDEDCDEPCPEGEICEWDSFYAFMLELLKVNEADQALDGAEFALYRELTAAEVAALDLTDLPANIANAGTVADPIWVTQLIDGEGDHITGITGETPPNRQGITTFGNIALSSGDGSEALTHNLWLREVEAPEGYRIIDEWMQIFVSSDRARPCPANFEALEIICDEDEMFQFIVDIEVLNVPDSGWQLPDTGGMGTIVLTVVGLALVGGALVLFLGGKKDEEAA